MTTISLPDTFVGAASENPSFKIVRLEGEMEIPLGRLHQVGTGFVPVEKLAANIASAFNGKNPIYRFGENLEMLFSTHDGGVDFHFREKDKDGVSVVGATYTSIAGLDGDLARLIENAPQVFTNVMASCGPERRQKERTQNSDGKKRSPRHTPAPAGL